MPDQAIADRIIKYCRSANIDSAQVDFIIAKSCDVIHQTPELQYDLILIDGCHGFPSVFVDFCYAAKALKLGGTLIVDDLHIYTCDLLALYGIRSRMGHGIDKHPGRNWRQNRRYGRSRVDRTELCHG